jgi:hypothetical protein
MLAFSLRQCGLDCLGYPIGPKGAYSPCSFCAPRCCPGTTRIQPRSRVPTDVSLRIPQQSAPNNTLEDQAHGRCQRSVVQRQFAISKRDVPG